MAITEMRKDYDFHSNQLDYDPKYWDDLFLIWYNNGRMPAKRFHDYVEQNVGPDPVNGRLAIVATFKHWIEDDWAKRADMLDEEVAKQLNEKLVAQKIEMLQRHAEIGRRLQNQALEFLEQNGLGNSRNAVVALTEGLKIEKESAGVIPFFEKVQDMSDDALVSELKVDWVKAYAKGVRFAWIKVSQGTNYADDMAAYNLPAAKAAGVKVGGYHFVTTDAASPQTTWFTQCLNAINITWDLPPAMDVEYYTPVSLHNDNAQQSLRALSMVNPDYESLKYAVGNLTLSIPSESTVDYIGTRMIPWMNDHGLSSWGYPAIYTNPSSGNKVFVSAKMRLYNLWVAHWGVATPTMPTIWKTEKYIAWQNTVIRGAQDWGVDGDVDHNYWGTKFPLTPAKENSLTISMPVTEFNSTYTGKLMGS